MSRVPRQTQCEVNTRTPSKPSKGKLAAAIGGAAALLVTSVVALWEGKSNDPYQDIVGVWTVCYGETNTEMRSYTDAECTEMLQDSLAEYGTRVLQCTPNLEGKPEHLAAAASLAYNIGTSAYCGSTVDRRFDEGDYRGACDAFLMWKYAGGQVVQGLVNRRNHERELCLEGLS